MRNGDDLHKLIKSLSKAEKRYFKIQTMSNTKKDNNNYILLFDAIDYQNSYNETKLCRKLRKYPFSNHLSKTKYLLYELILKTMQQLYLGRTITSEVNSLINSIEFLYEKTNYRQAYNMVQKAKKIANDRELNQALLQIIDWEKKINKYLSGNPNEQLNLISTYQATADQLNIENQFKCLFEKIEVFYNNTLYFYTGSDQHPEVQVIMSNLLMKALPDNSTFLSKIYFNKTNILIALSDNNYSKALTFLNENQLLWMNNPNKKEIYQEEYIHSLTSNFIYSINARQKEVDYALLLDGLRVLKPSTQQEADKTSFLISILDFMHSLSFEHLELAKMRFLDINELKLDHFDKLDITWKMTLKYFTCIFHFLEHNYEETLSCIDELETSPDIKHFSHIQNFIKLISLVTKFEQEKFDQLEYDIRKTYRYLKRCGRLGAIEQTILNSTKDLINAPNRSEVNGIFSELQDSLKNLERNNYPIHVVGGAGALYRWINEKLPDDCRNRTVN